MVIQQFPAPNGDFILNAFHYFRTGIHGFFPVNCGSKNEEAYGTCFHPPQAMVHMQAGQRVSGKSGFPDFMKFIFSHLPVSSIVYCIHLLTIHLVIADLTEKNTVGTNLPLFTVVTDGVADKFRADGTVYKNLFGSMDGLFIPASCCDFFHAVIPPFKL